MCGWGLICSQLPWSVTAWGEHRARKNKYGSHRAHPGAQGRYRGMGKTQENARCVLQHGTLALQVVFVNGFFLLLLQTFLIAALLHAAALPGSWVPHHTYKTRPASLLPSLLWG